MSSLDEDLVAWFAGDDDAATAALDRRLCEEPEAARRFGAWCLQEMALARAAGGLRHAGRATEASSAARRSARRTARRHASPGRVPAIAALVAAALVVAVIAVSGRHLHRERSPVVATCVDAAGAEHRVVYADGGERDRADVSVGDRVVTGHDSRWVVLYPDGTRIALRPDSEVVIDAGIGKPLTLARGGLDAAVASQPAGAPLTIATARAITTVVGTRFSLALDAAGARLAVDEGRVGFERRADRARVEVAAGWTARVDAGVAPLLAARAPAPLPPGATVVWRADADAGADGWIATRAPAPGDPAGTAAVAAMPSTNAPYRLELRTPLADRGWRAGATTYLRFRCLGRGFAPDAVGKIMFKRGDQLNYGGYIELGGDRWRVITVAIVGAPFIDHTGSMPVGEAIRQVVWLADPGTGATDAGLWIDDIVVFSVPLPIPATQLQP